MAVQTLNHTPFEPIDPFNNYYSLGFLPPAGYAPYEYTGWRDETQSWKTTCYLHTGLNPTDTLVLRGPEVIEFLSKVCCTNFTKFPVGMVKHGLMVNEEGTIIQDGVLMRTAEDEVYTYWMVPALPYVLEKEVHGKFDVTMEYASGKVFLFQIGGPISFEILEKVCEISIRDLKHLRFMENKIAGKTVRIARLGMAGTLAYEGHGLIEDAIPVYNEIWGAGQPMGMRRLGAHCYPMNHAENGYPQTGVHFPYPKAKEMIDYILTAEGMDFQRMTLGAAPKLRGSAGDDANNYFHNPYEFGWGKMIKFDHEFVGKEALEKIKEDDKRHIVTLEWNAEDVADVFASQFRDEEPYKYIEEPLDYNIFLGPHHDKVIDKEGKVVGISFGRQNSAYFHRMISICCLDKEYEELGTELELIWGDIDQRQKRIRVKVARYPYNNIMRNETVDVTKL